MTKSKFPIDFFISDFDQIFGKFIFSSLFMIKATFVIFRKSMTIAEHHPASALYSQKFDFSFASETF